MAVRGSVGGISGEFTVNRRVARDYVNSGALERVTTLLCLRIEREARKNAPVDTGLLRSSITHRVTREGSKVVGEVGTNVEYALPQEFGTRHGVPATRFLGRALQTVARQLETTPRS